MKVNFIQSFFWLCLSIVVLFVIVVFLRSIFIKPDLNQPIRVVYEGQCVAMPEYYRKITGFDSVQIVPNLPRKEGEKRILEANFCYPNKYNPYYPKSN
jgi:hypothetical protein